MFGEMLVLFDHELTTWKKSIRKFDECLVKCLFCLTMNSQHGRNQLGNLMNVWSKVSSV